MNGGEGGFCQFSYVDVFWSQASNAAGSSGWSADSVLTTPPGPPAAPSSIRGVSTPYSISLTWSAPICNGSPILSYQIDLPDRNVSTDGPETQIVIDQLKPQSQYRYKILGFCYCCLKCGF